MPGLNTGTPMTYRQKARVKPFAAANKILRVLQMAAVGYLTYLMIKGMKLLYVYLKGAG
jgi:hypothetical protein